MLAKEALARAVRIVLVEPSHPGNIGSVARAMKTMNLRDLVLVSPELYPDPRATWRAMGGADVLERARVVDDVRSAVEGCTLAMGTSVRHRSIPWPVLEPRDAAIEVLNEARRPGGRTAIIFGRESTGLRSEELNLCQLHLRIPASAEYGSLNVAMAVQVVCYELFVAADVADRHGAPRAALEWDRPPASLEDLEALYRHLEQTLIALGFHDPENPRQLMARLRRLASRIRPDATEVGILRGILSVIQKRIGRSEG
jgi:tRNA (cytidine32/uridine32-2'-O)-methyltransferase